MSVNVDGVVWEDPPPGRFGRRKFEEPTWLAALKAHPGRWGLVETVRTPKGTSPSRGGL